MTEPKYEEHTVPGINRVYKRRIPDCHPDGRHAANGLCVNCYQKLKNYSSTDNPTYVAWYTKNQDRILAQGRDYRRANQAKVIARRLGVSELEVREVLKESTCAICGDEDNLVVDHDGALPLVPHTTVLLDMIYLKSPEFWYAYDLGLLEHCDAMYVCQDETTWKSAGVQNEIWFAEQNGIPVLYDVPTLKKWVSGFTRNRCGAFDGQCGCDCG